MSTSAKPLRFAHPAQANHVVQFYDDEDFLCDAVARFLGAGLAAGEPLVVIATEPHRQAFRQRLESHAFDLERARETRLLTFCDAREVLSTFMVEGMPDRERFRTVVGGVLEKSAGPRRAHIRAYGEMVDLLWRDGQPEAAIRLEELWNELATSHSFSLLCAYVMDNFYKQTDALAFERVCRTHGHAVPTESYSRIETSEAKMRQVVLLQQRARALETEILERRELEKTLRQALEDRAKVQSELEEDRARLELLQSLTSALSKALSPEDVAAAMVTKGTKAVGAPAGAIWALDESELVLEMLHQVGYSEHAILRHLRIPVDSPMPIARCVADGREVWIESRAAYRATYPEAEAETRAGASSEVAFFCLPLLVEGRRPGAFSMAFDHARVFTDDEKRFLVMMTHQCAQALDRARLFDAERRARDEAQATSRIKDEFLATVSHELRTPLNAILGWAAMLRTEPQVDVGKAIETIERNARAQGRLIEDVLDVSRIIMGKLKIEPTPIDLAAILKASHEAIVPMAHAKAIELDTCIEVDPCPFYGDPDRLQQVFWNLLSNAVKFTPDGGRVEVRLTQADGAAVVSIRDTGRGIPADFLPFMFDRFRQGESSTTRSERGLGLGLAIVRHLIELHGGTVKAVSAGEGLGSTFTVSLPARATAWKMRSSRTSIEEKMADECAIRDSSHGKALAGVRVLVCEDDADARDLLLNLLMAEGANVRVAASVPETMAHLPDFRPDVLVSDIGLPIVDGYALIEQVRALSPGEGGLTPAIALTAYARREDARKAVLSGYQLHMIKPVEPSELVVNVAKLADRAN